MILSYLGKNTGGNNMLENTCGKVAGLRHPKSD